MTTQEAIDILYKSVPEAISENYELPALIGRVKEIIEKQIPIKPIDDTNPRDFFINIHCPVCKESVTKRFKYCRNCVHALDWSDEK